MMRVDRLSGLDANEQVFVQEEAGRRLAGVAPPGCPPPALLSAIAVAAVPDELAIALEAHVQACAICRQLTADLSQIEAGIDMLEEARIRRRVDRARRTPIWRVAALAASIAAAAGGAMLLSAAELGLIPAARETARVVGAGPQVTLLAPDKLPPPFQAGALVWRGSGDRYELDLATALRPYQDNRFKAASAALERVSARYPGKAEPLLYLGICKLLMDRPVEAERVLRRAGALGGPMLDDARWYLAVAVYQNGNRPEARQLLAELCRGNGARGAEACLAHDQIGESS